MSRTILCVAGLLAMASSVSAGVKVTDLRAEYLTSPVGIDVRKPRLSWKIENSHRGFDPAVQVQVATSEKLLASGDPDMWDTGWAGRSGDRYAGKDLASRTTYYWRVRVRDRDGKPSPFSPTATFETALLDQLEWEGGWIAVGEAGGNGYHSQLADSVDTTKWVQVDLGKPRAFQTVVLYHARPYNWKHDVPGFGFPARYRIEAADDAEFKNSRVILDKTDEDHAVLPLIPVTCQVGKQTARYIRITATKLQHPRDTQPLFALAEVEVLDAQSRNLALDAPVTALDSIEDHGWGKAQLTDGGRVSREPGGSGQILRREFTVAKPVARARAYVTGLGYYELRLNGAKVGDRVLDPPYTNFEKRCYYSTYDVTKLLKNGDNCAGAMLGQGWWRKSPRLRLMLDITYADGTSETVVTDESWRWAQGPITQNSLYNGETFDARLEPEGWDKPGFDDSRWQVVRTVGTFNPILSAEMIQPIKVTETLKPKAITNPKPGIFVYDFGQNFSGWCRLRVKGAAGSEVRMRYAELVYKDGTVNQENLRSAKATDTYILKGDGKELYEPRFTYHGFRYVQLEGFPGTPTLETVDGRVVHTSFEPTGSFECSNELINKIQHACVWGERTNFHSIPTDCPQRDERQGWMGDAWVSARAMLYNWDMPAAYLKFIRDIADAQGEDGSVPDTVPHVWGTTQGDPMWSIAYPELVWQLYLHTGDSSVIDENWDGMRRYLDSLQREAGDSYIISRNNYGDWIGLVGTPNDLIGTASYLQTVNRLEFIAGPSGRDEESAKYGVLREKIADAFTRRFFHPETSEWGNGSQASNAIALSLPVWGTNVHYDWGSPREQWREVKANLLKDVEKRGFHLSTGFIGTPYLLDALDAETAYKVITRPDYPGWGYMIENGATTIWELWELKTGNAMNSHNHPALGFVSGWFYETLAGLSPSPEFPGWDYVHVSPVVVGDLKWVKASVDTVRGKFASSWELTASGIKLDVTIPVGSEATIYVPKVGKTAVTITESGKQVWRDGAFVKGVEGIAEAAEGANSVSFEVVSGTYHFELSGK